MLVYPASLSRRTVAVGWDARTVPLCKAECRGVCGLKLMKWRASTAGASPRVCPLPAIRRRNLPSTPTNTTVIGCATPASAEGPIPHNVRRKAG